MSLLVELQSIADKIEDLVDHFAIEVNPALSESAIEAILMDTASDSLNTLGNPFLSSEENRLILDGAIKLIKRSITAFNKKIELDEVIPVNGFNLIVTRVDRATEHVRFLVYQFSDEFAKKRITPSLNRSFSVFVNRYSELLHDLNQCVIKYNIRHPENILIVSFSEDVSPLRILR